MPPPPRRAPDSGTTGALFDGMADASPPDDPGFEPTPAAARARLAAVRPAAYARTRNHLHGAVTRLSPYLTHGLLSLREVVTHLRRAHGLGLDHKLVQELGWRAWWHHAWRHQGEAIFASLHEGPLPEAAYAREPPAALRAGRTRGPVTDPSGPAPVRRGPPAHRVRRSVCARVRRSLWRSGVHAGSLAARPPRRARPRR